MRKRLSVFMLVAVLVFGLAGLANAEEEFRNFGIGLNGGVAIPTDPYENVTADASAAGGIALTYLPGRHVGIELAASRFETEWNDGTRALGDLAVVPVSLMLQYRMLPEGGVNPYVSIGGVYFINSFETSASAKSRYGKIEVENVLGFAAQAGLEFKVVKGFVADLAVKYIGAEAEVTQKSGSYTQQAEDADLGTTLITLGAKYYF